jgi:hypothetical protein
MKTLSSVRDNGRNQGKALNRYADAYPAVYHSRVLKYATPSLLSRLHIGEIEAIEMHNSFGMGAWSKESRWFHESQWMLLLY